MSQAVYKGDSYALRAVVKANSTCSGCEYLFGYGGCRTVVVRDDVNDY
jgi:hypothetical protein